MNELLLVSGSPRRRELLRMIDTPFVAHDADIDERRRPGETPEELALRLAAQRGLVPATASSVFRKVPTTASSHRFASMRTVAPIVEGNAYSAWTSNVGSG